MARYHVRADGSMGSCAAREGHCPFDGEEGTRHFTSKTEAQRYSEGRIKATEASSHGRLKRDSGGKKTAASKHEEDRVRSSSELLYGGVFAQDQLDGMGAKIDRVHERLMASSWNDVRSTLEQEYKGENLDDALLLVSYARFQICKRKDEWTKINEIRPTTKEEMEEDIRTVSEAADPRYRPASRTGKPGTFLNRDYDYVGRSSNGGIVLLQHGDRYFKAAKRYEKTGEMTPTWSHRGVPWDLPRYKRVRTYKPLYDKVSLVTLKPDGRGGLDRREGKAVAFLNHEDVQDRAYATVDDIVAKGCAMGSVAAIGRTADSCQTGFDKVMAGDLKEVKDDSGSLWGDLREDRLDLGRLSSVSTITSPEVLRIDPSELAIVFARLDNNAYDYDIKHNGLREGSRSRVTYDEALDDIRSVRRGYWLEQNNLAMKNAKTS